LCAQCQDKIDRALTTLAPLHRRISAIFAERLFHLLPFAHQADLAARLAPLLVPKKGEMVFGQQRDGKTFEATQDDDDESLDVFLHSEESWRDVGGGVPAQNDRRQDRGDPPRFEFGELESVMVGGAYCSSPHLGVSR
jgi:hypothetical protein